MTSITSQLGISTDSGIVSISRLVSRKSSLIVKAFLDAIDGSYCTYSAFGETGDCTDPECVDPAYPDPNPGGYKGQLQCGVYKPTNVISISYGGGEYGWPDYYMKRQCNEWMKLSLQGTTVVMSSGDSGVGGTSCKHI